MRTLHRKLFFVGPLLTCGCYGGHNEALFAGIEPGSFFAIQDDKATTLTLWRDQTFVALANTGNSLSELAPIDPNLPVDRDAVDHETFSFEAEEELTLWKFPRHGVLLGSSYSTTGSDYRPVGGARSAVRLFPDVAQLCANDAACAKKSVCRCLFPPVSTTQVIVNRGATCELPASAGVACSPNAEGWLCEAPTKRAFSISYDSDIASAENCDEPEFFTEDFLASRVSTVDSVETVALPLSVIGEPHLLVAADRGRTLVVGDTGAASVDEAGTITASTSVTFGVALAAGPDTNQTNLTSFKVVSKRGDDSLQLFQLTFAQLVGGYDNLETGFFGVVALDATQLVSTHAILGDSYLAVMKSGLSVYTLEGQTVATEFEGAALDAKTWIDSSAYEDRTSSFRHSDVIWSVTSDLHFGRTTHGVTDTPEGAIETVAPVAGFDARSMLVGTEPRADLVPRALDAVAPDRVVVALQSDAGQAELWELVRDPNDSSCQDAGPYCFRPLPGVDVIDCGSEGGNVLHVLGELDVLTVIFDSGYVWSLGGTCARVEGTQAGLLSATHRRTEDNTKVGATLALLTTDRNLIFERINMSSL